MTQPIRLGISQCLLGDRVRYDGQHKRDPFLVDTLGAFVEYVPVCPEVECGLPVPREAMRLVGDPAAPRLMTTRSNQDMTERMTSYARRRVKELEKENLHGFIFKAKSPSSGMERVKVYHEKGGIIGSASGLFAQAFMEHFPLLPVEEEGRLHDAGLRENFIERIFTLARYREAASGGAGIRALTDFHARHKLLLMSHSQKAVREMGRLLAGPRKGRNVARLAAGYETQLLAALKLRATPRKHTNVLQHMLGYFRDLLDADEKAEVLELVEQFKSGLIPLIVPVTLFRHFVRKYDVPYLAEQVYLHPHPVELKLRNHA